MKFVMRPYHMVSLGGYIVEWDFTYRNLIIVNETSEWIDEHKKLGLKVIPVTKDDNFLSLWKRAHAELDKVRPKNE